MGVLNSFFARDVGNSPIKKVARGFCPGGWSGLELTDTFHLTHSHIILEIGSRHQNEACGSR